MNKESVKDQLLECLTNKLEMVRMNGRPSSSILIKRAETLDFDVENVISEWAKDNQVNFAVVDIPKLTDNDVNELPNILTKPTVFLLKNYGDYELGSQIDNLREIYRKLLKDHLFGYVFLQPAPNFLFAVATVTSDKHNLDFSEKNAFFIVLNNNN